MRLIFTKFGMESGTYIATEEPVGFGGNPDHVTVRVRVKNFTLHLAGLYYS